MAGKSERTAMFGIGAAGVAVFLCMLVISAPVFAVKVKDSGKPSSSSSGTLITIETLEQISSRTATSTLEVETATSTTTVPLAATSTANVQTATATTQAPGSKATEPATVPAAAETKAAAPVVESSPATPAAPEAKEQEAPPASTANADNNVENEIPEAQRSQRYKDKLKEVSGEDAASDEPGIAAETKEKPAAEEPKAEKPSEVKPQEKQAEPAAVKAEPQQEQPKEEKPAQATPAPVAEQKAKPAAEEQKNAQQPETAVKTDAKEKPAEQPTTEKVTAQPDKNKPAEQPAKEEVVKKAEDALPATAAPAPVVAAPDKKPEAVEAAKPSEKAPASPEKKEPVAEKPAQPKEAPKQPQPEKAAQPKAQAPEKPATAKPGFFTVRSAPISDVNEKDEMVRRLTLENYHPAVKEVPVKEGRKYYILEMGSFKDVALATGLLYQLRNVPGEFFIVNPDGENVDAGEGLVPLDKAGRLIPHRSGELGDNSLGLISDYAKREGRAPAAMDAPVATGPRKLQRRLNAPKYIHGEDEEKPVEKRVEGLTLSNKLRDIAWEMREGGYGVYLEQETFLEKEGVLVGVMEDKEEASKLGRELLSYGYAVNIIFEGDGNYYVYADVDNPAREITVVDKELLLKHGVTDEFAPPPDPMADNLLRLIPKKAR